jgi:hypothetical protein
MWARKEIPDHWRWRWLVPIPKVPNPTLADLRPLSLIEPLRKVWTSIFVYRVQNFWAEHPRSLDGQHGFLKGRGTDTAVTSMINALETAREWKSNMYLSSWDMKRAFDSLPKPLLVFAWIRLGVPEVLAEYLVDMDWQEIYGTQVPACDGGDE